MSDVVRLLHAADLHLSETELEYGLGVLAEILDVAAREKADLLLLAGDTFDSFQDAVRLHRRFGAALEGARPACHVLLVPGNHEHLRAGVPAADALRRMSFGPAVMALAEPFGLHSFPDLPDLEILSVPHQPRYPGYSAWGVPPGREGVSRILLAHAALTGAVSFGPETEDSGGVMDADLPRHLGVSYAAMGHLHGARTVAEGELVICYPGSSRVWRRGETGPRGVSLVTIEGRRVHARPQTIGSAGEYRRATIALDLRGEAGELSGLAGSWGPRDFVEVELFGVVEDEHAAERTRDGLLRLWGGRFRRLEVRVEGVRSLAGISANPLAARFVDLWRAAEAELVASHGREVYERALRAGLEKLAASLEARGAVSG